MLLLDKWSMGKWKTKMVDVKQRLIRGICNVFHPLSPVVFHKQAKIWHLIYCFAWKTQMFSMKSFEQTEASLNNAQNWISPKLLTSLCFGKALVLGVGFTTTTKNRKLDVARMLERRRLLCIQTSLPLSMFHQAYCTQIGKPLVVDCKIGNVTETWMFWFYLISMIDAVQEKHALDPYSLMKWNIPKKHKF